MATYALATTGSMERAAPIVNMVLDAVSTRTRRDYRRALTDFTIWHQTTGRQGFNRAVVNAHVASLRAAGVPPSSINQRLAAIRKLAHEAHANGLIDAATMHAIADVKNIAQAGRKTGNWLTKRQAEAMLAAPDTDTLKGLRDRAILAVLIGCGLRREEVAGLTVEHFQLREARWVILDLAGKHGRVRTVPAAPWVKAIVDRWAEAAGICSGPLFRRMRRGDRLQDDAMSSQAVWNVVAEYAPIAGLAPHDLRRTFAKLAHKGGAPIEQIQQSLGHASVQTTERYLGVELDLLHAPSDYIQLDVEM